MNWCFIGICLLCFSIPAILGKEVNINRLPDGGHISSCTGKMSICVNGGCRYVIMQWENLMKAYTLCNCDAGFYGEYCEKTDSSPSLASSLPEFAVNFFNLNVEKSDEEEYEDIIHEFTMTLKDETDITDQFDVTTIPKEQWKLLDEDEEEEETTKKGE